MNQKSYFLSIFRGYVWLSQISCVGRSESSRSATHATSSQGWCHSSKGLLSSYPEEVWASGEPIVAVLLSHWYLSYSIWVKAGDIGQLYGHVHLPGTTGSSIIISLFQSPLPIFKTFSVQVSWFRNYVFHKARGQVRKYWKSGVVSALSWGSCFSQAR